MFPAIRGKSASYQTSYTLINKNNTVTTMNKQACFGNWNYNSKDQLGLTYYQEHVDEKMSLEELHRWHSFIGNMGFKFEVYPQCIAERLGKDDDRFKLKLGNCELFYYKSPGNVAICIDFQDFLKKKNVAYTFLAMMRMMREQHRYARLAMWSWQVASDILQTEWNALRFAVLCFDNVNDMLLDKSYFDGLSTQYQFNETTTPNGGHGIRGPAIDIRRSNLTYDTFHDWLEGHRSKQSNNVMCNSMYISEKVNDLAGAYDMCIGIPKKQLSVTTLREIASKWMTT